MKIQKAFNLMFILAAAVLAGCGGGGGGGADPNAPATVVMTVSRTLALADGSDAVTIQAEIRKADGTAVANGTPVAFSASSNACTLSAAAASTVNGIASVSLTRAPVADANNQVVTVTGSAGSASDNELVKFINQPASADVFIAFDQTVANLAALNFKLNSTAGAAFNNSSQLIAAINSAEGSFVLGNFDATAHTTTIGLINGNAGGFNTGTSKIIRVTFAIDPAAGMPSFSIDQTPASFTATDPNGGAPTPAISAANMVVTATFNTEL